jgi:hypothetical protein
MASSDANAKPTNEALSALGHRIGGQFQGSGDLEVQNVASIANAADRLFLNNLLSDVTIVADGTRLPAHRIVLYSQSSFFRAALSVDMKVWQLQARVYASQHIRLVSRAVSAALTDFAQEKLEGVINLPESLEVTKSILSFLYTSSYAEESTSPIEHSAGVYFAADKYDIPGLKTLAGNKLAILFTFLECRFADNDEPLTPELESCIEQFLELVVEVYNNTRDTDKLRAEIVRTARELLRTIQLTTDDNDGWARCFGLVPEFAVDLVKPNSSRLGSKISERSSTSWRWRAARDCVILECEECDTAVTMSLEAWEDAMREFGMGSRCPNNTSCEGRLMHRITNC